MRLQTSDARKPAPYEMLKAERYLSPGPGAAAITSDTSSMLRTVGSLRGCVRNYMYRFISSLSQVVPNKKRNAMIRALYLGGVTSVSVMCN